MKNRFWKSSKKLVLKTLIICIGCLWIFSCEEPNELVDKEPEWLGESIYDYLDSDGNFTYYLKLVDDVEYTDVLSKTGSKTVFACDDEAFERFFSNNEWNVSNYDALSVSQKKTLLNYSMIDNAYLIETLANYNDGGSLVRGTALRRNSSVAVIDNVPFESGQDLPLKTWWDPYRAKGMHILKDASSWPIVHFMQSTLDNAGISNDDFKLITGVDREIGDAHLFDVKIIKQDITCKNGYVHVLEDVLFPRVNIAEYINKNPNTTIFSRLLDRFSAPFYLPDLTDDYNRVYPDNPIDSIYQKIYFSEENIFVVNGEEIEDDLKLPINPGNNTYSAAGSAMQADMAAILAPNDDAMNAYFNDGAGAILRERYGAWDSIPDDIVVLLLKRHLRQSFLATVPNRFDLLSDNENSSIPADVAHITNSYVGSNGVVYETSEVYSPDDYVSVYGPVLFSEKARVFNWAINQNDYRLYLNSLVSTYSLFVPTDDFFKEYIDPLAYAKDLKVALKYWFNETTNTVNATVYNYVGNTVGDSLAVITSSSFLSQRLLDLLDSHIVIGDVESGSQYYFTKDGNALKISGKDAGLKIQAGNDIKQNITANVVPGGVYNQKNGKAYFIDKPLQTPLQSVYKVLSETANFSEFFKLLDGFSGSGTDVFVKKTNFYGMDFNILFFNTFNYTVYVPTNDAILQAVADSLIPDWDYINAFSNEEERLAQIQKLERFVRYHFQDNSVYIGGNPVNTTYQTATIKLDESDSHFNTYKDKYYKIGVNSNGSTISLTTESNGKASVVKDNGLYNIMTRDYVFSDNPQAFTEADGSGTGTDFSSSSITTASTAVIHQIDNILNFE